MKNYIQRHPLASYFFMVFTIAWVGSILAAGPKYFRGEPVGPSDSGLMAIAMLGAPIVSGILMTSIVNGRQGLKDLFGQMKIWRLGKWYLALLLFPFLIVVVSLLLSVAVSPEFAPIFVPIGILMGILAGFLEEIGWMGFAFPNMRLKHGPISTSIYLGFLHGIWHMVVWFLNQSSDLGGYWPPYFIAFVLFVVALRIIIVWVYSNTNSLLIAQLMHASSTGFLVMLTPTDIEPVNWVVFYAVYAVVMWVVALVVIRKYGRSLAKQLQ
ncbi:MAG: CPBP family intramembrane metalloprotease [Chloroflexota bacterium]|nr:MAG: CPBP family intramembrane metalloprotease [Chloroflexota bacterium]